MIFSHLFWYVVARAVTKAACLISFLTLQWRDLHFRQAQTAGAGNFGTVFRGSVTLRYVDRSSMCVIKRQPIPDDERRWTQLLYETAMLCAQRTLMDARMQTRENGSSLFLGFTVYEGNFYHAFLVCKGDVKNTALESMAVCCPQRACSRVRMTWRCK